MTTYYFIVCHRLKGDWQSKTTEWREGDIALCRKGDPLIYTDEEEAKIALHSWQDRHRDDVEYFIVDVDMTEVVNPW